MPSIVYVQFSFHLLFKVSIFHSLISNFLFFNSQLDFNFKKYNSRCCWVLDVVFLKFYPLDLFYWITHLSFAVMSTFSSSRSILSSSSMLQRENSLNYTYLQKDISVQIFCKTHACSWLWRCCTSSFRLSTMPTNSANKSASRSRCASVFRQSSTDNAARSSRFNSAYFVSKSFSCSLFFFWITTKMERLVRKRRQEVKLYLQNIQLHLSSQ